MNSREWFDLWRRFKHEPFTITMLMRKWLRRRGSGNNMHLSNSELKQLDLLKKKKPIERFLLMAQLIDEQFEAMRAGIRYQNPHLSEKEINECLRARMMEMYFGKRWEEKFK